MSDGLRSGSRLRYSLNLKLDLEADDLEVDVDEDAVVSGEEVDEDEEFDFGGERWDRREDDGLPTIISEPGQATPLQRKWIEAMSEGKEREVVQRFQL